MTKPLRTTEAALDDAAMATLTDLAPECDEPPRTDEDVYEGFGEVPEPVPAPSEHEIVLIALLRYQEFLRDHPDTHPIVE